MLRVLMLGWEFPPLFSGGLGIATYGIVKSLSRRAAIRLILPNNANTGKLNNVTVLGLNNEVVKEASVDKMSMDYTHFGVTVDHVPLSVSPYHHMNYEIERAGAENVNYVESVLEENPIEFRNFFSGSDVYGASILKKVALYGFLVERMSAAGDFDVIHAHDWVTFSGAMRVKKATGKPLVVHIHALETDRAGEQTRNVVYHLEREAMLMADAVIAVSEFTKAQIVRHYDIDPSKIHIVHNGIEPAKPARKQHQVRDKLVVFLGRLTQQKGPDFLLETAEKVIRVNPNVKFVVAGTGDQFPHLLQKAAARKLGNKFLFTGFVSKEKADELLAMADVYIMPSVSEPFGLTALEAAQHGVPSVLSSQSGAVEVLRGSLQADFWDTDKFANYVVALLRYDALRKQLSTQIRSEANLHTWDFATEKIWSVYQTLQ